MAVPSTPGPPGRATVVVIPLLIAEAGRLPVWLEVVGPPNGTIRGVNCPLATPAKVVCGNETSERLGRQEDGRPRHGISRRVTVQADLPAGGSDLPSAASVPELVTRSPRTRSIVAGFVAS